MFCQQLQFGNLEVGHPVPFFPNTEAQVKNDVFERMEYAKGSCDVLQDVHVDAMELR